MISWYFIIASMISIPLSLWLIREEWIDHHRNCKYIQTESIITNLCIGCFLSLFWPALSVIFIVKLYIKFSKKQGYIIKSIEEKLIKYKEIRFGYYLHIIDYDIDKHLWICQCKCGKTTLSTFHQLSSGKKRSCGCLRRKSFLDYLTKHGYAKTPEYKCWVGIKNRCYNNKSTQYQGYGSRGIKVSKEWIDSFPDFLVDMGRRPSSKHSIDRIDVNGDYCFENCRWATLEQQANNKRNTIYLTWNNKTVSMEEWAKLLSISYNTLYYRYQKKWNDEQILTTPVNYRIKDNACPL